MFWLLSLLLFLIICIITITIITTIILVIIVIFCIPIVLLLLLPLLFSLLYPQCIPWLSPMCEMWDSISTPEIDRFATSQNLDSDWSVAKPSRILVVLSLMRCVFFSKHILTLCYELWLNSSMIVVWWNSQRLVHHGLITLSISYLQLSTIILKYHIKFIILIRYRINIYIYIRYVAAIPLEFSQRTTIARPRVGARAPCTNPSGSWIPCRVWLPKRRGSPLKLMETVQNHIDTLWLWLK